MEISDKEIGLTKNERIETKTIGLKNKQNLILCDHCKRTASNGIRCLGMCVADNEY